MKILVTGAFGQIGTDLTAALRTRYGEDHVVATGHYIPDSAASTGPIEILDVTDAAAIAEVVRRHGPVAALPVADQVPPVKRPGRVAVHHQHDRGVARTLVEVVHAQTGNIQPV